MPTIQDKELLQKRRLVSVRRTESEKSLSQSRKLVFQKSKMLADSVRGFRMSVIKDKKLRICNEVKSRAVMVKELRVTMRNNKEQAVRSLFRRKLSEANIVRSTRKIIRNN